MRKNRLIFWIISLVICAIIIIGYKNYEKKIPEEEKKAIKVYCSEKSFCGNIKGFIKEGSIGKTHKAVFIDNKDEAELIFTDEIFASDNGYEKIGWSPLVIAIDNDSKKIKSYKKEGYIIDEDGYTIEFNKIIKATLNGEWKEKIYYPSLDTREGKLFFDFLLVNINGGSYPKNEEEMQACVNEANEFLNNSILIQTNVKERLKNKKIIKDELYITFENDLYNITDTNCSYEISYPSNTVIHEWYWKCVGENANEIKQCATGEKLFSSDIYEILSFNHIRNKLYISGNYNNHVYVESEGFSYVEIPLKEK